MTITIPITTPGTISAPGTAREALLQEQTDQLCDQARMRIAAHSSGAAECREVALMLGLAEVDPDGSLEKVNPWDTALGDSLPVSPKG